ncbi:alpha/beta fold hydrolase [Brevibacterium sp. VCM10]|uniref:alpha/beta fold hydrolase n=1 Tax=Brevibacterium sp. VCM10 TaxID=1381751 RepID=UPI000470AECE|nr:alpha/beta hydrolase [Brevibacterium sp. VCM10]
MRSRGETSRFDTIRAPREGDHRYVRTADESAPYGRGRNRAPSVVFIHGFSCSSIDWINQLDALSTDHRCIAIDLPGHGQSPIIAEPTIASCAAAIVDELDRLGAGDVVLAGHSLGSRVMGEVYRQSPESVRGIAYVEGSILEADPTTAARDFAARMGAAGFETILDGLYDDFFVETSPRDVSSMIRQRRGAVDPDFHPRLLVDMVDWDAKRGRDVLCSIDVPCLVLQSTTVGPKMERRAITEGDDSALMRLAREQVPDVRIETVEGVGHFPMLEAAERTNEILRRFLSSL